MKCLAKDPADRFESVQELEKALLQKVLVQPAQRIPERQPETKPPGREAEYAPAVTSVSWDEGDQAGQAPEAEEPTPVAARSHQTPQVALAPAQSPPRTGRKVLLGVLALGVIAAGILGWQFRSQLITPAELVPATAESRTLVDAAPAEPVAATSATPGSAPGPVPAPAPAQAHTATPRKLDAPVATEKPQTPPSRGEIGVWTDVPRAHAVLAGPQWESKFECETPCRVEVTPGRYTLEVTLAGYRTALRILNVSPGGVAPAKIQLEAQAAQIQINTQPPGAEVWFDGQHHSEATPTMIWTKPGSHTIRLQKPGYDPYETKVELQDESLVRLNVRMAESR